MAWIPHLMVVDDDPRVLDSLVPGLIQSLGQALQHTGVMRRLDPRRVAESEEPIRFALSAHGYESKRVALYRQPDRHQIHLHLVRDAAGHFAVPRALLNRQFFAVVVSDLRFSDEGPGLRAGKLLVEEVERVHPECRGILYSAYPRPDDFSEARFVRKSTDDRDQRGLVETIARALEEHLAEPGVQAFVRAIAEERLVYQSESFGATLSQCYELGRLLGNDSSAEAKSHARVRRPLPCVLLDGESGTGKRGLAAVIHAASSRRDQPFVFASCNDLTNETLLRSALFGHKRGAYTDAREERRGLVATAGKGVLLLDDFHRLPAACAPILHSFLEDGLYSRLGEEETRRQAECLVVITVETDPWRQRRRSGELSMAFLARVERFTLLIPPLRERPEDIIAQAREFVNAFAHELGTTMELDAEAEDRLRVQPLAESNSRELRNALENAVYRSYKETDVLTWRWIEPWLQRGALGLGEPASPAAGVPGSDASPRPARNPWQDRLVTLAGRILARSQNWTDERADEAVHSLFEVTMPRVWAQIEQGRSRVQGEPPIPMPVWEDLWRCFAVYHLGGPAPAERVLGIPANTLRQWINDRESRHGARGD